MTPARYRQVTGMALMALAVIVVTGTAVRLTESGLGCSDWPTCEKDQLIADFSLHPMIEFINRVFTGFVAVAVVIAVLGSLFRKPRRADLTWLSLGLVAGVIGQIFLGAFVVKSHLNPWLVLNHSCSRWCSWPTQLFCTPAPDMTLCHHPVPGDTTDGQSLA